jgi:DNA-binding MurR/RpiR family transcriptional regulator
MDILKQISESINILSPKQQKVAKYILDNWEKASFESAITIAKKMKMSQSSVIRTVNALGFNGVPHLQSELRDFMQTRISTVNRMERASRMQSNDGIEGIISTVLKQSNENIRATLHALDVNKIDTMVRKIKKAKRVYVLGMRSSASLAQYLGFNLNLLLGNVVVIDNNHGLYEKIRVITAEDVLISISFSRYTRLAVESTRIAHERNATIIGLTDSMGSPIAAISQIVVIAQVSSLHLSNSYVSVMSVFDIILSVLLLSDKEKYMAELEQLEAGLRRLKCFESENI